MPRAVVLAAPRDVRLVDEPDAPLAAGSVRIETLFSGISAGTELTQYRGSNPHLHRRWDARRRLFVDGDTAAAYPLRHWGYEQVGRVVERAEGAGGVAAGAVVWGRWGHRSAAVVAAEAAQASIVPDGVPPVTGVFAPIGAVALNAVLDAGVNVGETAVVFGLGVPGLLCVQLARLSGARVVAVDLVRRRLELAGELGASVLLDAAESPAEAVKELTGGRGADVAVELSGSYDALAEAVRATAAGSRVVAAGFYQGGAAALRLGEELHHNRIELVASQIGAIAPRLAHRWTRSRLEQTVMRLAAEERLALERLVSHVIPAERAADAFRLLDESPEQALQVVLDFGTR